MAGAAHRTLYDHVMARRHVSAYDTRRGGHPSTHLSAAPRGQAQQLLPAGGVRLGVWQVQQPGWWG